MAPLFAVFLLLGAALAYQFGRRRALAGARGVRVLNSRPTYHGSYLALACTLPPLLLLLLWTALAPTIQEGLVRRAVPESVRELPPERLALFLRDARAVADGATPSRPATPEIETAAAHYGRIARVDRLALAASLTAAVGLGFLLAVRRIRPEFRARERVERILRAGLVACSTVAILVTIGIVLSLVFESALFFEEVPLHEFLFGLQWSPQTAIRPDQVGSSGAFGAVPVFAGTLLITGIAMAVAVPIGLMSAIYLSDYAVPRTRAIVKPLLEILAGIPTVVYGFFAALTIAPWVREWGNALGLGVASESALAAGAVMGVMIIPFVSSLSDDVISAVPNSLREGSLGLGATESETIRRVVLPAALPGIVGAVLLAISRAIGETMIVVMAAGLAANLTANPFEAVTTVTVQIVTLLVGDQEFDSAKTLAAFALGLVLFVVTLALNVIALFVVRRYQEQYD